MSLNGQFGAGLKERELAISTRELNQALNSRLGNKANEKNENWESKQGIIRMELVVKETCTSANTLDKPQCRLHGQEPRYNDYFRLLIISSNPPLGIQHKHCIMC